MIKKVKFKMDKKLKLDILGSISAVVLGLFAGLILMIIISPQYAFPAFFRLLFGGFGDPKEVLYTAAPLILVGLSIAFAFKTGLFNIGAAGQLMMGAFVAVYIGVRWVYLKDVYLFKQEWLCLHWIVAYLGAMLAGAIWGFIPGMLKAFRNVNEVVSGIMLNYVSMYFIVYLIVKNINNSTYGRSLNILSSAEIPVLFENIGARSNLNLSIIIALLFSIIIYIILNHSTFGFELKAVGYNKDASNYAGINSKRNIVLSLIISGALAGAAGGSLYLVSGKTISTGYEIMSEGFTGIAVALLGLSSPIGTFIAGIFYGLIETGGTYVQLYGFTSDIIDVIIGVIIYFSALMLIIQKFIMHFMDRKKDDVKVGDE